MANSNMFECMLYDNEDKSFDLPYSLQISNIKQNNYEDLHNKLTIIIDISGSMNTPMTNSNDSKILLKSMTLSRPITTMDTPVMPMPVITPPSLVLPPPMFRAVTCGGDYYSTPLSNTRLDIAKEAVIKLVKKLMNTNITLTIITFSDTSKIIYQGPIHSSINDLVSSIQTEGSTNIGSALKLASSITDSDIILLSDGKDTHNTNFTPYQNKITCIGIGEKDNDWDNKTLSLLDKYGEPSSAKTSSALRNRIMSLTLDLATSIAKNVEISVIGGDLKSSANQEDMIIKIADWGDGQSIFGSIIPKSNQLVIQISYDKDGNTIIEKHPIMNESIIHNKIIYEQISIYNNVTSMITNPDETTDENRVLHIAKMDSFLKLHRTKSFGILEPLQKSIHLEMKDKGAKNICSLLRETSSALTRQVTQSSYLETFNEDDEVLTECVICYSETRKVVLRPCQHFCACITCSQVLLEQKKKCPICRADVMKVDIIDKTEDKCVVCNINKPTRYIQDVVSKCISHCETCYPKEQRTIRVKFP